MNRKLILISCDNGGHGYLPGVTVDMANYNHFFRSAIGGAWMDSEIRRYDNITRETLHQYIVMTEGDRHVDYWLIVFCGHGHVDFNNNTQMILTVNNEISELDIFTWVTTSRCLLISDCCREVQRLHENRQNQEVVIEEGINLDNVTYRDAYNDFLRQVPSGTHCSAFSASIGESAGDNGAVGGIYSYNLLNNARRLGREQLVNQEVQHPLMISFEEVHNNTSHPVEIMTNNDQHPICRGNIDRIPFVVIA